MAEIQIPHWIQARWELSGFGQKFQFGQSYVTDPDVTSNAALDDFCTIVWDLNIDHLRPIMCDDFRIDAFSAETHYPQSLQYEGSFSPPSSVFGLDTVGASPMHTALSVRLATGRRGRRFNGRYFLAGMGEDNTDATVFFSPFLTQVADFASTFLASIVVDDMAYSPAIASRAGGFMTLVSQAVIENFIDSQRRRLAGRGD